MLSRNRLPGAVELKNPGDPKRNPVTVGELFLLVEWTSSRLEGRISFPCG